MSAGRGKLEVTFARSKKTATWEPAKGPLLELALATGVGIPFGCAQGRCGTCVTRILEGEIEYPAKPEFTLLRPGFCLPCVALPKSRLVLDV